MGIFPFRAWGFDDLHVQILEIWGFNDVCVDGVIKNALSRQLLVLRTCSISTVIPIISNKHLKVCRAVYRSQIGG